MLKSKNIEVPINTVSYYMYRYNKSINAQERIVSHTL